jgi:hypothetical protein
MPDALKGEFVNVGVVLVDEQAGFADVRFATDWRRVRCLDAAADLELLQALETDIRAQLVSAADREAFLRLLQDNFGAVLHVSNFQGCLTDSPQKELDRLAEMYLESKRGGKRELTGRHAILNRMRDSFAQAGVWDLMRKRIPVAQYTHKGDPLKLDCGYRPNGVVHLFHAVSLQSDLDAAKVLAFSYPQIREGIARLENAKTELTAVTEDDLDRGDEGVAFALQTFERTGIAIAAVREMPQLAQRAQVELRV